MTPCPITADRDEWRGAVTEREAALESALIEANEALNSALSYMDKKDDLCVSRRIKSEMQAAYHVSESLLARAHTAAEGERPDA